MAKRNSQLTELLIVAQDDYLTIVDTSAGQSKRVSVKNLTGLPDTGWIASGEAWTFSSWDSTTRTGVITVPTDATTKYTRGNRIRIAQSTGGTKYGIIHKVTATTLTVFFPTGTTLNNEAINTPVWSPLDSPVGFDKDPDLWTLVYRKSTRTTQGSATVSTWYNVGGSLAIGIGKWLLSYNDLGIVTATATGYLGFTTALGTSASGSPITDTRHSGSKAQPSNTEQDDTSSIFGVNYDAAAATTLYLLRRCDSGSGLAIYSEQSGVGGFADHFIKATSAYL